MATGNVIYPLYKQALLDASANVDINDGTVKVALSTAAYNSAHEFYSSVSASSVGTPQTIANTTVTNGLFDGDNVVYTAVPSGSTVTALIIYIDTGTNSTSRLVAFLDTGITGIPFPTNGGDVNVNWNASGIFQL
jgi:hypothetical protein